MLSRALITVVDDVVTNATAQSSNLFNEF